MSVQIADLPSLAGDRTPIPVNYVRNLVELVHEFGLDTDRLLAHVGLTQAEVYSAEPALRFEQFQRVMAGARDLSGDPAIGLALGRQRAPMRGRAAAPQACDPPRAVRRDVGQPGAASEQSAGGLCRAALR